MRRRILKADRIRGTDHEEGKGVGSGKPVQDAQKEGGEELWESLRKKRIAEGRACTKVLG